MKPACLVLLLCVICSAQTKNGTQHKATNGAAFAASALAAYDSIRSLEDNADAPDVGFQPRQIEAEKNLATAWHKVKTDEDKRQFAILKTWMQMISSYREYRTPPHTTDVDAVKRESAYVIAKAYCTLEADLNFNPSARAGAEELTRDKRMDEAKKVNCVESAKDADAKVQATMHP
jgi:hypothetical protein